jgi:uncharacterized protein (TIGR04255 family)
MIFRSATERTAFQPRRDGLAVSWLGPYRNWPSFRDLALLAWREVAPILKPEELHSVALRYINRFEFPIGDFRLSSFFNDPPKPPRELPDWQFHNFSQQTRYSVPGSGCSVKVVFESAFGPTPAIAGYILDIEARPEEPLTVTGWSAEDVLEELRVLKNQAFFGLLTAQAAEKYR